MLHNHLINVAREWSAQSGLQEFVLMSLWLFGSGRRARGPVRAGGGIAPRQRLVANPSAQAAVVLLVRTTRLACVCQCITGSGSAVVVWCFRSLGSPPYDFLLFAFAQLLSCLLRGCLHDGLSNG